MREFEGVSLDQAIAAGISLQEAVQELIARERHWNSPPASIHG